MGKPDSFGIQFLDTQSHGNERRTVLVPELPAIEKVGHGQIARESEGSFEQVAALQIDQDGGIRDQNAHQSDGRRRLLHLLIEPTDCQPEQFGGLRF